MTADGAQAWRVAALTMMSPEELAAALSGEDAALWVEAAASCGMVEAQIRLGRMQLEGQGVEKNERAAFENFRAASKSGDADAHNMLGRCHENGWGTARDMDRAAQHFRIAADAGLDWAQYNLAHILLDAGRHDEAFAMYSRAASQGHARAMNLVARCCEEGWGTPRDPAAARDWYRRSAEGGYFRGAYNYATILVREGRVAEARSWLERAATDAPPATRETILRALAQISART